MLFNDTLTDWQAQANTDDSMWITVQLFKKFDDFSFDYPIDLTITVRGRQDEACPASSFMM